MSSSGQYGQSDGSGSPVSLGPGARPITSANVDNPDPRGILQQVQEIRSHYSVSLDDSRSTLDIGFDLKGRHRHFSIPFANMPLGSSSQWLLYGGSARCLTTGIFVTDIIRGAENMAQRDLTQMEAEGHACHASRRMLYSFAAVMSSVTIGAGMATVGRSTMKFPFRKAQPLERYDNFPNRYLPLIRGQYARTMWHITRANVYTLVSFLLLQPLYSSMGDNALTVGLYRDSRTAAVLKEMKANKQNPERNPISRIGSNIERSVGGQPNAPLPRTQQKHNSAQYQDPDPEGYYDDSQGNSANDYSGRHDYDNAIAGDSTFTDDTTDTNMLTDAQMKHRESKQSSPSSFSGTSRSQRKPAPQTQKAEESGSDYFFDDASPTAGNDPDMSTGMNAKGSAWERVRRGQPDGNRRGVTPAGTQKAQSSRELQDRMKKEANESTADSFSFSKGDEERQLAKEQAQKDFDKMVDAERRGSESDGMSKGDGFNTTGGDGVSAWERRRNR